MKFRTYKDYDNKDIWLFSKFDRNLKKNNFNNNLKLEDFIKKTEFKNFLIEQNLKEKFDENYKKNNLVSKKIFKYFLSHSTKNFKNSLIIKNNENTRMSQPFSNNFFNIYYLLIKNKDLNLYDIILFNKTDDFTIFFDNYFEVTISDWITENKEKNILQNNYFSLLDFDKIKNTIFLDLKEQINLLNLIESNYEILLDNLNIIKSDFYFNLKIENSFIKIDLKKLRENNPLNFIKKLNYEKVEINEFKIFLEIIQQLNNKLYFFVNYKDYDLIKFKNIDLILDIKKENNVFNNLMKKINNI